MIFLNKTFLPSSKKYLNRNWFIVDCKNKKLGHIATFIVSFLKGKKKFHSLPSVDIGDHVIIINANLIKVNKANIHYLVNKPGKPGCSLKIRKAINSLPKLTLERSIKRMLNKTETKRLMGRLKIYNDDKHPHKSQIPFQLDF